MPIPQGPSATQFWLQQQTRRLESSCHTAETQIRNARTIADVKRAAVVHVPPELRAIRNTVPAYRSVQRTAKERVRALLEEHLKRLRKASTAEECKALMGQLNHQHWDALRGDFAHEHRWVTTEARSILFQKEKPAT